MGAHIEANKVVITTKPKLSILIYLKMLTRILIIKYNKPFVEHTIKNKIRQLLSKYKHGNNIQEREKQQNE